LTGGDLCGTRFDPNYTEFIPGFLCRLEGDNCQYNALASNKIEIAEYLSLKFIDDEKTFVILVSYIT